MKRSLGIGLSLAVIAPVVLTAAVSWGASSDTGCWDEYNKRGTRMYRTVTPQDLALEDCTPASTCKWGYAARNGRRNRLYVPHGQDPATACSDITAATLPPITTTPPATDPTTPPPTGTDRFELLPVGTELPSEATCAAQVRPMTENRPDNAAANATPGSGANTTYPRVTGNFTGTTDEIIQWTACKWGIDEDMVRAQIVNESFWNQGAMGDFTTDRGACIPRFPIGNYPPQYNGDRRHDGECPESIGLGQVRWLYHQSAFDDGNAIDSTAYNLDYTYAVWRTCLEGGFPWLNEVDRGAVYAAGDPIGCLGVWFSGRWYTDAAVGYIDRFNDTLASRTWEQEWFPAARPAGSGGGTTPPPVIVTTPPTSAQPTSPPTQPAPSTEPTPPPTQPTMPETEPTTPPTQPAPPPTLPAPPPTGARFVETFDGDTRLERFDQFVFHRNVDVLGYDGYSGGSWTGDHDLSCGSPDTQRPLRFNAKDSQATRQANSFYTCRNHMMTSMGDVEAYSIVAFSPKQTFDDVTSVEFDVSLTDLGNRQWLKFGVLSTNDCPALDVRCMYSDVDAADIGTSMATPGRLIFSWSGGLSAGHPGGMKIGNTWTNGYFSGGDDKATRHPVSIVDNGNGTVSFTVAGVQRTVTGSFPECPCRVVFYDHNYTPDKNEFGPGVQYGYTYHWDNIIIR